MRLPQQKPTIQRQQVFAQTNLALTAHAQGIIPQGCNPLYCGANVAGCFAACGGGLAAVNPLCALCLGSAYNECKDCF